MALPSVMQSAHVSDKNSVKPSVLEWDKDLAAQLVEVMERPSAPESARKKARDSDSLLEME